MFWSANVLCRSNRDPIALRGCLSLQWNTQSEGLALGLMILIVLIHRTLWAPLSLLESFDGNICLFIRNFILQIKQTNPTIAFARIHNISPLLFVCFLLLQQTYFCITFRQRNVWNGFAHSSIRKFSRLKSGILFNSLFVYEVSFYWDNTHLLQETGLLKLGW